jgi:hypothetical protein
MRAYIIKFKGKTIPINIFTNLKLKVNEDDEIYAGILFIRKKGFYLFVKKTQRNI